MYQLNPAYQDVYSSQEDALTKLLNDILQKQERSYGARGVTGRARTESENIAIQDMLRRLGLIRSELGTKQLGREQALSDIGAARKYKTKMTYADWAQREKAATTAFGRQKELLNLQEQYAKAREDRAKRDARNNLIRSIVANVVTGGVAGAIMPKATGAKTAGAGFLRGAVMGPSAVGTSAMYGAMLPRPAASNELPMSFFQPIQEQTLADYIRKYINPDFGTRGY